MARFTTEKNTPTWRRVAASSWKTEAEASIYGWIDIDTTVLQDYIARLRQHSGVRVTVTHLVGKAIAEGFAGAPQCNAYVSFGRMRRRDSVDVFFSVAIGDGKNLSGAKVKAADKLTVPEIAQRLQERVDRIRGAGDTELQKSQSMLRSVPSPVLGALMRASTFAMYDLGLDMRWAGIPNDPFGTVVVTNVGVLGVEQGVAPLMPQGRAAALLTVGKIRDKVIPVDGKPEVRPVLTIGGTFDHRIVDGYHLGHIGQRLRDVLHDPDRYLGEVPPVRARSVGTPSLPRRQAV